MHKLATRCRTVSKIVFSNMFLTHAQPFKESLSLASPVIQATQRAKFEDGLSIRNQSRARKNFRKGSAQCLSWKEWTRFLRGLANFQFKNFHGINGIKIHDSDKNIKLDYVWNQECLFCITGSGSASLVEIFCLSGL